MLTQLIHTFSKQDYANKELIVSDDSPNDRVQRVVKDLADPCIKYIKNSVNLGLTRNSLQVLKMAQGSYVILLGDDDLFVSEHAISAYVHVFEKHPSVMYVNSNGAQFSNELRIENVYRYFRRDTLFHSGEESMKGIWTTAINMSGIGVRNTLDLDRLYPHEHLLFPQLEHVGHLINRGDSYGIASELVGIRAHPGQLGYRAIKGELIKGGETHGVIELFNIFRKLQSQYDLDYSDDFLARQLVNRYSMNLLKERLIVGRRLVRANCENFRLASPRAKKSLKLRISYYVSQIMPRGVIRLLRFLYLAMVRWRHRQAIAALGDSLSKIVADPHGRYQ
jgi:glycosyltransferase involved in cell wall biosynthesis